MNPVDQAYNNHAGRRGVAQLEAGDVAVGGDHDGLAPCRAEPINNDYRLHGRGSIGFEPLRNEESAAFKCLMLGRGHYRSLDASKKHG